MVKAFFLSLLEMPCCNNEFKEKLRLCTAGLLLAMANNYLILWGGKLRISSKKEFIDHSMDTYQLQTRSLSSSSRSKEPRG
uniref:Uncharacterized protein n=1 Tax=Kalanchoe fedtschenkoi TaxID=63787 RepID=A0A7N0UAM9_KALFE